MVVRGRAHGVCSRRMGVVHARAHGVRGEGRGVARAHGVRGEGRGVARALSRGVCSRRMGDVVRAGMFSSLLVSYRFFFFHDV